MNRLRRIVTAQHQARAVVDPLAALSVDFTGGADLSSFSTYKPAALDTPVTGTGILLRPVAGASGPTGSLWFTAAGPTQFDGWLAHKTIDAAAFDVRARWRVRAGDGTSAVPATIGEWRFAVLSIHDPNRASYYRYIHVGLGSEGGAGVTGVEVKVTRVNGAGGESVYPVAAASVDADIRIVRVSAQVFEVYHRPISSGEPLASDVGWTQLYTINWADGTDAGDDFPACPVETDAGLPTAVQVGLSVYSNVAGADISGLCDAFLVRS